MNDYYLRIDRVQQLPYLPRRQWNAPPSLSGWTMVQVRSLWFEIIGIPWMERVRLELFADEMEFSILLPGSGKGIQAVNPVWRRTAKNKNNVGLS